MAGSPRRRAQLQAALARAEHAERKLTYRQLADAEYTSPNVIALAGALLLGRERNAIACSGRPLAASLAILDQQLSTYVAAVERRLTQEDLPA